MLFCSQGGKYAHVCFFLEPVQYVNICDHATVHDLFCAAMDGPLLCLALASSIPRYTSCCRL